jgi:hypothetical protein
MASPKDKIVELEGHELEKAVGEILEDDRSQRRFRIFFNNEYYPCLIPVRDKMLVLHHAIEGLIKRGALNEKDREIVDATQKLADHWFVPHDH